MSDYLAFVEGMVNKSSTDEDEAQESDWEIHLGFDEGISGYWLTIREDYVSDDNVAEYIFHNMRDIRGHRMKISEVESTLEDYGVGIPYALARELARDGIEAGYLDSLEAKDDYDAIEDFQYFCESSLRKPRRSWEPLGRLPSLWEPFNQKKRNPPMGYCPVRCPAPELSAKEAADKLFSEIKSWAQQEGYDSSSLKLWNSEDIEKAVEEGSSYCTDHVYQISWEQGPENWSVQLITGNSFHTGKREYFLEPVTESILGFHPLEHG